LTARNVIILRATTKRVPWNEEEDELILSELKAKGSVSFQHLLDQYRDRFHPSRTVRSLEAHFYRLKRSGNFTEVENENVEKKEKEKREKASQKLIEKEEGVEKFSNVEKDAIQLIPKNTKIQKEERIIEKRDSKKALKLEKELQLNPFKSEESYAEFTAENVKFKMERPIAVIGRRDSKDSKVDINLSTVGNKNTSKISRKQAILEMTIQKKTKFKFI